MKQEDNSLASISTKDLEIELYRLSSEPYVNWLSQWRKSLMIKEIENELKERLKLD